MAVVFKNIWRVQQLVRSNTRLNFKHYLKKKDVTDRTKHYKNKQWQTVYNMSIVCVKTNGGYYECVYMHTHLNTHNEYFWKDT